MNKKSQSWNVKKTLEMITNETFLFNHPCQRPADQWNIEKKSKLIDSILRMFILPMVAIQEGTGEDKKFSIIDGKQRLTTIHQFLTDQFVLSDNLDPVILDSGGKFEIAGKKFSELDSSVQEEIKGFSLVYWIIEIEDCDDEDQIVEEIFYRLNNGEKVSNQHLTLISTPKNIQDFISKMMTHDLYTKVSKFTESQVKKSDPQMSILQTVLLLSGKEFDSLSARHVEEFYQNNQIDDQFLIAISDYFDQLAGIFNNEFNKFVMKIHIPSLCYLISQNPDKKEKVNQFILWYSSNSKGGDRYRSYCGAGNVKKENTKNRIEGIQKEFENWIKNPPKQKESKKESKKETKKEEVTEQKEISKE